MGKLFRVGVGALEHRELLQLEPELREPGRSVLNCLLRALSRGGSRYHESRSWFRSRGQHAVLLFVAWIELVSSDEREHTRHDP